MKAKHQAKEAARTRYGDEFKQQALKRAECDGVALVAQDLGIAETQILRAWRRKRRVAGAVTEEQRLKGCRNRPAKTGHGPPRTRVITDDS